MKDPKDPLHSGVGWEQLHGKEIPFVGRNGNDCLSYGCWLSCLHVLAPVPLWARGSLAALCLWAGN